MTISIYNYENVLQNDQTKILNIINNTFTLHKDLNYDLKTQTLIITINK